MSRFSSFKRKTSYFLCALLSFVFTLSGCENIEEAGQTQIIHPAISAMESAAVIGYTLPEYSPNLAADRNGYNVGEDKEIYILADNLPESFIMCDYETGTKVYGGNVEYNEKKNCGVCDISSYNTPGIYYIQCEEIGRSYEFEISATHYEDLLKSAVDNVIAGMDDNSVEIFDVLSILTAYEWYPGIFADEKEDDKPEVLKKVYDYVAAASFQNSEENESALIAALLAKFSYSYQKYDKSYATDCLKLASAYYNQSLDTESDDSKEFLALTELYRASGLNTYKKQLEEYEQYFKNNSFYLENNYYLMGAMTYMVTRQRTSVSLCSLMMKDIRSRAEEISDKSSSMINPISAKNDGEGDIRKRLFDISFANFVIPSFQYNNILKQSLHYLGGANNSCTVFMDEENIVDYLLVFASIAAFNK